MRQESLPLLALLSRDNYNMIISSPFIVEHLLVRKELADFLKLLIDSIPSLPPAPTMTTIGSVVPDRSATPLSIDTPKTSPPDE